MKYVGIGIFLILRFKSEILILSIYVSVMPQKFMFTMLQNHQSVLNNRYNIR